MHNRQFILHLTLIKDIGSGTIQKILEKKSECSSSDFYHLDASDMMRICGVTAMVAHKLVDGLKNKKCLEYELDLIERHAIEWITIEDDAYPPLLREIYLPPMVLYSKVADVMTWQHHVAKCIAVVGARKADNYGQQVIDTIIPDLIAAEYTIVSGGARGIDTMAHEAALRCGGRTIAVLGSGLLRPYPHQNKNLFNAIAENGGAVVSSFPLTAEPLAGNFPARNRIITGLSQGCLVVQAAQKSGALISAHYATEQGREVFAVPGPFNHELSIGCNTLIQHGAKLVMNSADILTEFGDRMIIPSIAQQIKISFETDVITPHVAHNIDKYAHYSERQKFIIAACKNPATFDDIIAATQFTSEVIHAELFDLSLDGVISQDFSGMWHLSQ